ncbi:hypothetical protein JB92DRAFT_3099683 [Gautieria morchelliformis]|nr:hypothetical protein JB92DRAFT_3099683 [Gautieria morchelliformis]
MTETTCLITLVQSRRNLSTTISNPHSSAQSCSDWVVTNVIFLDCSRGMAVRTLVESGDGTAMPVFYIIDMRGELFHFSTPIGPGKVSWRIRKEGHPGSQFAVKEAWRPFEELPGRESEGSLLRHAPETTPLACAAAAQAEGVVSAVAQLEHFEQVRQGDYSK